MWVIASDSSRIELTFQGTSASFSWIKIASTSVWYHRWYYYGKRVINLSLDNFFRWVAKEMDEGDERDEKVFNVWWDYIWYQICNGEVEEFSMGIKAKEEEVKLRKCVSWCLWTLFSLFGKRDINLCHWTNLLWTKHFSIRCKFPLYISSKFLLGFFFHQYSAIW